MGLHNLEKQFCHLLVIQGIGHCILVTAKLGPMGFYKGFVPAFVRLAPHTILTFIFFEQLRKNFGYTVVLNKPESDES